jgi:hypothetical protein
VAGKKIERGGRRRLLLILLRCEPERQRFKTATPDEQLLEEKLYGASRLATGQRGKPEATPKVDWFYVGPPL